MKHDHLHVGYIIALLFVLSLYVGCSGQSSARVDDYRFGSQALDMRFSSGNPHQTYVGDELVMLVEMRNKGTADIENGQIYLSGFDPSYLKLQVEPPYIDLKGKDQFDPNGDFTEVFTISSQGRVDGPDNVDRFQQMVQVTACYEYRTFAVADVCIDSDPYNKKTRAKACTSSTVSVGGQGHPVVVTSVEPIVSRDTVRFNIRLTNSGTGVVYNPRLSTDTCAQGPEFSDLDRIIVTKVALGGKSLDCSPSNPIWLNRGSASLTCECRGDGCIDPNVPAYKTLLEMDFRYGYRDTISTQMTVINPE